MVYDDGAAALSHQSVRVKNVWTPAVAGDAGASAASSTKTGEQTDVISVQPELKLPSKPAVAGSEVQWELTDNVHPFWVLPRQKKQDDQPNLVIEKHATTVVVASQPKSNTKAPAGTETYRVELPFITNKLKISTGDNLMLTWFHLPPAEKNTKTW